MKRKQLKFAVGAVVIILTLSYLAYSGFQESKTYYQTVPELFDRVILLNGELIAEGPVKEAFTEANIHRTYGTTPYAGPVVVADHHHHHH